MKKLSYILVALLSCITLMPLKAQDASAKLKEAQTAYSGKNLDNARFALQEALVEINKAIGKEILGLLPAKLGDMASITKDDNVSGAGGFAGLVVTRTFGTDPKSAKIEIISDSPLVTSINAMLALPAFMGGSDPNSKRIKIAGYKGMQNKSENSETKEVTYTIQIPLNSTLLTLTVEGIFSENEVTVLANSLPLEKIAKIAQ